jgi:hypothetical protein
VKDGEERWFVAFGDRELPGDQADVGCGPRQLLAFLLTKCPENRNPADLVGRYQGSSRVCAALDADPESARAPAGSPLVVRRSGTVSDKSATAATFAWWRHEDRHEHAEAAVREPCCTALDVSGRRACAVHGPRISSCSDRDGDAGPEEGGWPARRTY